jgi:putative copper export protein
VLLPAWGSAAYSVGGLPPRVIARLFNIAAVGFILTVAANGLALLQQTMVFFDVDALAALSQWEVVRSGTRFGDIWTARMLALGLALALFAGAWVSRTRRPAWVRAFWSASAPVVAIVLATISAASHAAGAPLWTWGAVFNDWLHMIAVGFWVGGVVALAWVLPPALAPYQGETRRAALLAVLRRFSRLAVGALAVVVASGVYASLTWFYHPDELATTTYGNALVLKVLLIALLVGVGALHHVALRPALYARVAAAVGDLQARLPFVRTLRLEALFAVAVLVAVGVLSSTPVPNAPVQAAPPVPSATQTIGDLTLTLSLTPGGPGVNTYDVRVNRNGAPLTDAAVRVQQQHPARDERSRWQTAEAVDDGVYVYADAAITRDGLWWSVVEVDGQRAAFAWQIDAAASIGVARAPTVWHALSAAAVIAATIFALWPLLARWWTWLDLSPTTAAIGAMSMVFLVGIVAATVVLIDQSNQRAAQGASAPPQYINSALPDTASLARGEAAFNRLCADWVPRSAFASLRGELAAMRDQTLWLALRDGFAALPPCAADADDALRWDMVNYLRTLDAP